MSRKWFAVLAVSLSAQGLPPPKAPASVVWKQLQPGVTYAAIHAVDRPALGDGVFHVVRLDTRKVSLRACASSQGGKERTAAEWAQKEHLAVAINAGMFAADHRTHTGYFQLGAHVNSAHWVGAYKSVLLVPGSTRHQPPSLVDLPMEPMPTAGPGGTVVQNLRLIESPGRNVWAENGREWSEAAIASTRDGSLLFIFSRSPLSMHRFNDALLGLGLEIERAAHLEGGPEASLSIHAAGVDLDLAGSYETGFMLTDSNHAQWPLPNVLGVDAL